MYSSQLTYQNRTLYLTVVARYVIRIQDLCVRRTVTQCDSARCTPAQWAIHISCNDSKNCAVTAAPHETCLWSTCLWNVQCTPTPSVACVGAQLIFPNLTNPGATFCNLNTLALHLPPPPHPFLSSVHLQTNGRLPAGWAAAVYLRCNPRRRRSCCRYCCPHRQHCNHRRGRWQRLRHYWVCD